MQDCDICQLHAFPCFRYVLACIQVSNKGVVCKLTVANELVL
jgi:hypothetical protein